MRRLVVLLASALTAVAIHPTYSSAENLIDNSDFYSTMSPWKTYTPDLAYFTPAINHTSFGGGSVFLGGGAAGSMVSQCVGIPNGLQYVVSAWVKSSCAGSRLYVYWTAGTCDVGLDYDYVEAKKSGEWEQLSILSAQPPDKSRAVVILDNPGGSGECASGVFFDDVSVQRDLIFWDTFDPFGVERR